MELTFVPGEGDTNVFSRRIFGDHSQFGSFGKEKNFLVPAWSLNHYFKVVPSVPSYCTDYT
jgi:hypothetical protein